MAKIQLGCLVMLAVLAAPAATRAGQKPPGKTAAGEEVIVVQSGSGEELHGRLVDLSPESLSILVDGRRIDVPIENVLRIDSTHDSLKNGAIIGAAVMGGLGALSCADIGDAAYCATALVIDTGIGALIGAGIDALHKGRSPIYVRTAGKSAASLEVKLRF